MSEKQRPELKTPINDENLKRLPLLRAAASKLTSDVIKIKSAGGSPEPVYARTVRDLDRFQREVDVVLMGGVGISRDDFSVSETGVMEGNDGSPTLLFERSQYPLDNGLMLTQDKFIDPGSNSGEFVYTIYPPESEVVLP